MLLRGGGTRLYSLADKSEPQRGRTGDRPSVRHFGAAGFFCVQRNHSPGSFGGVGVHYLRGDFSDLAEVERRSTLNKFYGCLRSAII